MTPRRRITPAEQAAYRAADWTTPWPTAVALGETHGRDPRVVLIWAQLRGLAPRGNKRVVGPEDIDAVRQGVAEGLSIARIAERVGLGVETCRRIARREGLPSSRTKPHDWGAAVCARCGMRADWPGARQPCVKAGDL